MKFNNYVKVNSLKEAYDILSENSSSSVIGGGMYFRLNNNSIDTVIDLSNLDMEYIKEEHDVIEIGAYTTLRELEKSTLLKSYFNGLLSEASAEIVGVQLRNMATMGGTVYGRYGFSDILTPLLVLNTSIEFYKNGRYTLNEFLKMKEKPRDILTKIVIEKNDDKGVFKSIRLTNSDFSMLNAAVVKNKKEFKIAIGARPMVCCRAEKSENIINKSEKIDEKVIDKVCTAAESELTFGNDVKASFEYRRELCGVLVKRCLQEVLQ